MNTYDVIMGYMTDWQFVHPSLFPSDDKRQIVIEGLIESNTLYVSHFNGWKELHLLINKYNWNAINGMLDSGLNS